MKFNNSILTTVIALVVAVPVTASEEGSSSYLRSRKLNCVAANAITLAIANHPSTTCSSNDACHGYLCRLIGGLYLTCDERDNFDIWPALCDGYEEDSDSNDVGREGNDDCRPLSGIADDIRNHKSNTCPGGCPDDKCRLVSNRLLSCDQGNYLTGYPTVCAGGNIDITIPVESSSEEEVPVISESVESSSEEVPVIPESVESSSEEVPVISESSSSSEEEIIESSSSSEEEIIESSSSSEEEGTMVDVPVRSDCVETSNPDYAMALSNEDKEPECKMNSGCSIGKCRLATSGDEKWMLCDEGNYFDFWKSVCDEDEVPIRQPVFPIGMCFPGTSRVMIHGKEGTIPMSELRLGDSILVDTNGTYEKVYTFGHYSPDAPKAPFVKIMTQNGSELTLSESHMIKTVDSRTIPASQILKGDSIYHVSGKTDVVVSTKTIRMQKGMYAPFTASGYLIVDDILVSNYVALIPEDKAPHQWIAHAFNAPHRMYCNYFGCMTERYNEEGISQFVAKPLAISKWILNQKSEFITNICFALIVMLCGFFSLLEQLQCNTTTILIILLPFVAANLYRRRQKSS